MKLVVGLGNPGPQYDRSRHNVGFVVVDRVARRYAPDAIARSKFHGAVLETQVAGQKLLLLKPTTYMNRSGIAVAEATRFYKLEATDVLIVVDDVALPCGLVRIRAGGGTGGHNGLADIEQKLGTSEYGRLRIGIDPPVDIPQKDYVLGRFRPDQLERIEPALEDAVDAVMCWVREGVLATMNKFNTKERIANSE